MSEAKACPNCGALGMSPFYEARCIPVHSVQLLHTREQALTYPTGDIQLAFCSECGFISNVAFDPKLHDYSSEYESTQSHSPTFTTFHRNLAQYLIDRYDLHEKVIIEIGCGQGEFLMLLTELGNNRGIGFDPAYDSGRTAGHAQHQIRFVNDFYSEKYAGQRADFMVCKMTLEHIPNTLEFVTMVRQSVGDRVDTVVFFQVPDVRRILREQAFWDIYYEHCSYFSLGSLARVFRKSGFAVSDLWLDYGDQYIMIEACPANGTESPLLPAEDDLHEVAQEVAVFAENCKPRLDAWRAELRGTYQDGRRAVLWGGGSKAVAFLTALGVREEIEYVVDINPLKHGTFLAGTGQEVVSPDFLQTYQPDLVIVMNPVYCDEVQSKLEQMGVRAKLRAV